MDPTYPGGDADPLAVPGVDPPTESGPGAPSYILEVDGERFAVRPDGRGGTGYTWLTGPNPGYGFGVSPTPTSLEDHLQNVRDFLAAVDPGTGYLEDD